MRGSNQILSSAVLDGSRGLCVQLNHPAASSIVSMYVSPSELDGEDRDVVLIDTTPPAVAHAAVDGCLPCNQTHDESEDCTQLRVVDLCKSATAVSASAGFESLLDAMTSDASSANQSQCAVPSSNDARGYLAIRLPGGSDTPGMLAYSLSVPIVCACVGGCGAAPCCKLTVYSQPSMTPVSEGSVLASSNSTSSTSNVVEPSAVNATLRARHPSSWRLQGSQDDDTDNGRWFDVDWREGVAFPSCGGGSINAGSSELCSGCSGATNSSLPAGIAVSSLIVHLPRLCFYKAYRLLIRHAKGGGERKYDGITFPASVIGGACSPAQQQRVPLFASTASAVPYGCSPVVLSRLQLWGVIGGAQQFITTPSGHDSGENDSAEAAAHGNGAFSASGELASLLLGDGSSSDIISGGGWGWRLVICGPPQHRRLRLIATDRLFDMLAVGPQPLATSVHRDDNSSSQFIHVAVAVALLSDPPTTSDPVASETHRICLSLWVDGSPQRLVPMTDVTRHGIGHFVSGASDQSTDAAPTISVPAPRSLARALVAAAAEPKDDHCLWVGGPAFLSAFDDPSSTDVAAAGRPAGSAGAVSSGGNSLPRLLASRTLAQSLASSADGGNGGPSLLGEPGLAEDAPSPFPSSSLACYRGRVRGVRVAPLLVSADADIAELFKQEAEAAAIHVPGISPPLVSRSSASAYSFGRRATPLSSLEHALLWTPPHAPGPDEASSAAPASAAGNIFNGSSISGAPPAMRQRYSSLIPSDRNSSGSSSSSTGLGLSRLVGHGAPLSILCHDCGPAVYTEDALAGAAGSGGTGDGDVSDVIWASEWAVTEGRKQALTAEAAVSTGSQPALPAIPADEALKGLLDVSSHQSSSSSSPSGGRKPHRGCMVHIESLPLEVDAMLKRIAGSLLSVEGVSVAQEVIDALPPDSLLRRYFPSARPYPSSPLLVGHCYRLLHWQYADVFIYFSHARISIPPPSWIAACRAHGVPVLGTIITEWAHGEEANEVMARQAEEEGEAAGSTSPSADGLGGICPLALSLARLAAACGFHGWLVNIEAPASYRKRAKKQEAASNRDPPQSAPSGETSDSASPSPPSAASSAADLTPAGEGLRLFLSQLTRATHALVPDDRGCVMWYDSLDYVSGRVAWRSAVDADANLPFLHACDGLFLDYHWDEGRLRGSGKLARAMRVRVNGAAASAAPPPSSRDAGTSSSSPATSPTTSTTGTNATVDRSRDVAVGIDLWGRGMPGGGKWGSRGAIDEVRRHTAEEQQQQAQRTEEGERGEKGARIADDPHCTSSSGSGSSTSNSSGLSLAMFAPAWPYEECGGRVTSDVRLAAGLEAALWTGAGQAQGRSVTSAAGLKEAAAACSNVPVVVNPSGRPLPPSSSSHSSPTPVVDRPAQLAHMLDGWAVTKDGGQGWAVDKSNNDGGSCCFVTSNRWCVAQQTVWLPGRGPLAAAASAAVAAQDEGGSTGAETSASTATSPPPLPSSLTVSEWYAGTGPNHADSYFLRAWLVDAQGRPVGVNDTSQDAAAAAALPSAGSDSSTEKDDKPWPPPTPVGDFSRCTGLLTCAADWRQASLTLPGPFPHSTAGVVIQHGGKDAECWAGHFGARMRGLSVTVPRGQDQADEEGLGCGLRLPDHLVIDLSVSRLGLATDSPTVSVGGASDTNCITLPPSLLPFLLSYAPRHGIRPVTATLPFATSFCDGVGGGMYAKGQMIIDRPWTAIGRQTPLPSFVDHHAIAGMQSLGWGCEVVATDEGGGATALSPVLMTSSSPSSLPPSDVVTSHVSHHCAWERGSCVLITAQLALRRPPSSAVAGESVSTQESRHGSLRGAMLFDKSSFPASTPRITAASPLRLFALDLPLSNPHQERDNVAAADSTATATRAGAITVSLVYRVEATAVVSPPPAVEERAPQPPVQLQLVPALLLSSGELVLPSAPRSPSASDAVLPNGWQRCSFTLPLRQLPPTESPNSATMKALELWLFVCASTATSPCGAHTTDAQTPVVASVISLGHLSLDWAPLAELM